MSGARRREFGMDWGVRRAGTKVDAYGGETHKWCGLGKGNALTRRLGINWVGGKGGAGLLDLDLEFGGWG